MQKANVWRQQTNAGNFRKLPRPILGFAATSVRYLSIALARAKPDKAIEPSLNGLTNLGKSQAQDHKASLSKMATRDRKEENSPLASSAALPASKQTTNRYAAIKSAESSHDKALPPVEDDPEYDLLLKQVETKEPLVKLSKNTKGGQKVAVHVLDDST